jgi:hypothetical protein
MLQHARPDKFVVPIVIHHYEPSSLRKVGFHNAFIRQSWKRKKREKKRKIKPSYTTMNPPRSAR